MAAFVLFFFFQAEDGIRDLYVTGVQTCALPISRRGSLRHAASHEYRPRRLDGDGARQYAARRHLASGTDDRHGRPANDGRLDPRPDRRRHQGDRAIVAAVRRQAPRHEHRRDHRSRRRHHPDAGGLQVRAHRHRAGRRRAGPFPGHRRAPALPQRSHRHGHQNPWRLFRSLAAAVSMLFDLDPIYLVWLFVAVSAGLTVEAVYLMCYSAASYRSRINRRLMLSKDSSSRENVLVELRRERGLTSSGDYRLGLIALNRLVLQSGLTLGFARLFIIFGVIAVVVFAALLVVRGSLLEAGIGALFSATVLPYFVLRVLRSRRQRKFGAQFPDALDIIVRSLRAGHPVPIAIAMVGREMPDPIGSEFGIVSDEITYGADLETAMRNLYGRIGSDDLPLFVTAVAIQGATGGNLGEILENLSGVIRQRFKMRRKIRALAAEGRASAMILSALPIGMFVVIQVIAPDFYGSMWHEHLTKVLLFGAAGWMAVGNIIMFKMVNFKI